MPHLFLWLLMSVSSTGHGMGMREGAYSPLAGNKGYVLSILLVSRVSHNGQGFWPIRY